MELVEHLHPHTIPCFACFGVGGFDGVGGGLVESGVVGLGDQLVGDYLLDVRGGERLIGSWLKRKNYGMQVRPMRRRRHR